MAAWCLYILALCTCCFAVRDTSFKFRIPAGWYECFYEEFNSTTDVRMELYYEVIKGGELDIKVSVSTPEEIPVMLPTINKNGWLREVNTGGDGPYSICLDNTFSHISDKIVFLNLVVHEKTDQGPTLPPKPERGFNDTTLTFSQSVAFIRQKLINVSTTQTFFTAREARHMATVQSNYDRVFVWSLIETVVMVTVFLLQVFIIRQLVGGNRKRNDGLST